jgi:hypothetical protein
MHIDHRRLGRLLNAGQSDGALQGAPKRLVVQAVTADYQSADQLNGWLVGTKSKANPHESTWVQHIGAWPRRRGLGLIGGPQQPGASQLLAQRAKDHVRNNCLF